jgi:hypothetical protein
MRTPRRSLIEQQANDLAAAAQEVRRHRQCDEPVSRALPRPRRREQGHAMPTRTRLSISLGLVARCCRATRATCGRTTARAATGPPGNSRRSSAGKIGDTTNDQLRRRAAPGTTPTCSKSRKTQPCSATRTNAKRLTRPRLPAEGAGRDRRRRRTRLERQKAIDEAVEEGARQGDEGRHNLSPEQEKTIRDKRRAGLRPRARREAGQRPAERAADAARRAAEGVTEAEQAGDSAGVAALTAAI